MSDTAEKKRKTSREKMETLSSEGGALSEPVSGETIVSVPEAVTGAEADFKVDSGVIKVLTVKPKDKYKFQKSLGYGGMKTVLQVRDKDTTRDIAMAVIPDSNNRPVDDLCRFVREARILANLEHPNIVPIYDIGIDGGNSPYFTMKLLKGGTLADILKKLTESDEEYRKKYDLSRLLQIFLRVCNGMAFAHSKNIIHLDLKPENIQTGDFGEVIIIDWGIAKIIGQREKDEDGRKNVGKPRPVAAGDAQLTMDGVTKGTPGYMAPEQAAGKNAEKDKRTDIYALGGILYAILTLEDPIDGESIQGMLCDTVMGNITPPHERKPDMLIPSALEAVVMKAMALDPNERYQNVMELRDEIYAFIGGFCTVAEKASFFKKTVSLIKRHRLTSSFIAIIIVLLFALGAYAVYDYSKQTADWINVYEQDFTKSNPNYNGLLFLDKFLQENTDIWASDNSGLKMEKYNWLWFENLKITENVKVVIKLICTGNPDAIEVCLNSRIEKVPYWWNVPTGYSFQFGGYGGTKDIIFKNEGYGEPDIINIIESKLHTGKVQEIVFQREGETLSIIVDGKETLKVVDLFPPIGPNLNRIGIRTFSSSTKVLSVSVSRLALPEKASPLIAGDALAEGMHFDEAISKYLTIAENYGTGQVAEKALTKAYITAATKLTRDRDKALQEIKKQINGRFAKFRYLEMILEVDAIVSWREKEYKKAFALVPEIFKINPDTNIVVRLLECQHQPLPPATAAELMSWICKTKNLKRLNLSNLGLETIAPLKDLHLLFFDCSNNQLANLDALEKMELETLSCANNQISSLKPLRNMSLRDLNCYGNQIADLKPLRKMSLKHFDCSNNQISGLEALKDMSMERLICRNNRISDLSPLKDMPLKYLNFASNSVESILPLKNLSLETLICSNNRIKNLQPLEGMQLETLDCASNRITDLGPLEGMQLENLDCSGNNISSLKALKNMPLKTLELFDCDKITDLGPLLQIECLERLGLPPNAKNTELLKKLPALKKIYRSRKEAEENVQPENK
ncbi:MAG: hypothetical protein A2017_15240 [Lentisphaerae bacterium GWF2_44_16]|nr:MAG: hypothetical protein A2017_15240 [Lentisphaerae bacterium GWF2_44_16]